MNQALTVRKTLLHETHEGFLIIRKPFTMMLGFIELFPPGWEGGGLLPYISQIAMCNLRQALPIYLIFPPFSSSPFLACIAGVFCGPRALHNPAFASYGRHLGYENAQRAGVSLKRDPKGEHD